MKGVYYKKKNDICEQVNYVDNNWLAYLYSRYVIKLKALFFYIYLCKKHPL